MLTSLSGVICSGNICFDILVRPVDRIEWNRTIWVDSIEQQLGGNGSNTSYTLALLGVPVKLLGMVGQDAFGDQLLAVLAGSHHSDYVPRGFERRPGIPTPAGLERRGISGGDRFSSRPQ
jgi:sugar/nucleoside kinase (ribokinase family)